MNIRSIARTAAIIYADSMSNSTTNTIKRRFIESVFINKNNALLTVTELVNHIEEQMGLSFSEDEIRPIIKDEKKFVQVLNKSSEDIKYNLEEKRYIALCSRPVNEIDEVIDKYFSSHLTESISITKESFKELIYRYLHSVLNINISAYSHFINPKEYTKIPKLNSEQFEDTDIDIINDFVKWDNEDKNKAIFKLVNYCIEYAVIVNNSSEDILAKSLQTKVFYLDNALLYRALGINGETRKKRTLSFLKKCKESGQRFVISKFTRQEFFNTVEYHLKQLNSSTPFGKISPKVFKYYSNGDGFYQFYHEWRNGRINYGFDIFKTHIYTLYKELVKKFDINEDFNVPFDEKEEPSIITSYKDEIQSIKRTNRNEPHYMDARNMYWIECIRDKNNYDVASTKYYFVTSDQKLQCWDKTHSVNQPLTLLPSQWMGLILKYVSRSSDDYKSFISFMNIPKDKSIISENELQSVMAGISEMTEDFSKQESIVESMMEIKFENILKGNIPENAKVFAKDKLEKEFTKKLEEKEIEKNKEKAELTNLHEQLVSQIKKEAKTILEENEKKHLENKYRDIIRNIESLKIRKGTIIKKVNDRRTLLKTIIKGGELLFIIGWIVLIVKLGWDRMEMWTYFIGLPCCILPNLYMTIKGKSFKIDDFIEILCQEYEISLYEKFDFSESELEELEKMREQIQSSRESIDRRDN